MRSLAIAFLVVGLSMPAFLVPNAKLPAQEAAKIAVPPPEKLDEAEKLVRDVYKADFAKTGRAGRLELAKKLFERANAITDSPTDRFVLLRESANAAISVGDAALAWKSIAAIEKDFAVSGWELKASALETAGTKVTAIDASRLGQSALVAFDEASGVDPDVASRLLTFAQNAAQQTKDAALLTKVQAKSKAFEKTRVEIDDARTALETLKKSPDDPDANLKAGRYLCFMRGDWDAGLPLLAKGNGGELSELAKKDLANPADAPTRTALGDAWYAEAKYMAGARRTQVLTRACTWYRAAVPNLTGFMKVRIEKRLTELAAIPVGQPISTRASSIATSPTTSPTTPSPVPSAKWTILFRSSDPSIWNSDVRRSPDDFAVPLASAPTAMRFVKMTNLASGAFVIVEATRAQLGGGNTQGRYCWIGQNNIQYGGHHLGIADMDFMAWGQSNRGQIDLVFSDYKMTAPRPGWRPGRHGWGFGNRCMIDDVQGYSWGPGKVLEPTAFEIAVTAGPLGSVESASFLSDDLVKLAKIQGVASLPDADAWLTVFRSSDPRHWGLVDRKGKDHFALDLRKTPDRIRYLKLTDTSSGEFVIVETTKQALYAFDSESSCGWRGDAVVQFNGTHLGICDRKTVVGAGEITIAHNPSSDDCGGWGFGHRHSRNDVQGYCWAGRPLAVTVFEIAVKSGTLSAAEKAQLLPR